MRTKPMEQLRQAVNRGANWIVELDIEAFYDRIDHELLMKLVEKRICDRRVLKLLRQWLKAGVLDDGKLLPSDQGVPQGGVISCVLANVVLHELDRLWEDRCSQLGQLIRYADDAVVLCRTEAQAREALWRVGVILNRLKLTLHPTKTQVVYVGDGRQGFDFLGFHCRKVESWKYRGHRYLQRWPSRRAMQRVRDRVKAITAPRHRLPEPIEPIVAEVNQVAARLGCLLSSRATRRASSTTWMTTCTNGWRGSSPRRLGEAGISEKRYTGAFFAKLGVYQLTEPSSGTRQRR